MIKPPLIVHIIYRLDVGGLENGLVNLINQMPESAYRHAIICVTETSNFSLRITRKNVEIYELHKQAGQDLGSFKRCYQLLKKLQPTIVHTRNLAAIEYQLPAFLAGVKHRVHGEHGWDVFDPEGNNKKYQYLRRFFKLFIQRYIPLSTHLEQYLTTKIKVPQSKITRICNGVDTKKFYPLVGRRHLEDCPLNFNAKPIVIGTVGRMHGVKDQITLVKAFIQCYQQQDLPNLRLVLVGDGELRQQAIDLLTEHQLLDRAWLAGQRDDIAELLRCFDVFVLPSQAEGISNTLLEAMATALPIVATAVGGNTELVAEGKNGSLVKPSDSKAMATAILSYVMDENIRQQQGEHSLERVKQYYSLSAMVNQYQSVYNQLLED